MEIIGQESYVTQPWKNGLGVTREIACAEDGDGLIWRLSLARVTADGPFSGFPGLHRILTVVSGAGMTLASDATTYVADPMKPLRFSGDPALDGFLHDGPVENFNLIFDPARVAARVHVCSRPSQRSRASETDESVIHVVSGKITVNEKATLNEGDSGLIKGPLPELALSADQSCVCVELTCL